MDAEIYSGSVNMSYGIDIDDLFTVTPAIGVSVSVTDVDNIAVVGGQVIDFDDQISVIGVAGLTLSKAISASDDLFFQPFLSGTVYHEFKDDIDSKFIANGDCPENRS